MNDEHGAGSVYFMRRTDGLIKIGRWRHVQNQLKELNRYKPTRGVTLIHTIATNMATILELALYQRFAEFHLRGEWFFLPASELQVICGVRGVQVKPDIAINPAQTPCICRNHWKGWEGTTPKGRRPGRSRPPNRPPEGGAGA